MSQSERNFVANNDHVTKHRIGIEGKPVVINWFILMA
jgi:hypothetical protein